MADHYGRRAGADKLALTDWTNDRIGPPLLREGLAWFKCQVVSEHPVGDHVLVVGRVIDGRLVDWKPSPCAIAKPAEWTVLLLFIPTFSESHDAPKRKRPGAAMSGLSLLLSSKPTRRPTSVNGASPTVT